MERKNSSTTRFIPNNFLIGKFSTVTWARWRIYSTCTSDFNKPTYHYSKTKKICFLVCNSSRKFPANEKNVMGKRNTVPSQCPQDWHISDESTNQTTNQPTNQRMFWETKSQGTVEQSCELPGHNHHHRIKINISGFALHLKKKFNISWQVLVPW